MHPRVREFSAQVERVYGLELDVREFPEGTKTAADAAAAIGCDVSQIASSIVVSADGELAIAITSGANRVSFEKVCSLLEATDVTMADSDEIADHLGWSIGGVPPLCHDNPVPILFDETLLVHETVWAAAGTPQAVFPIAPELLVDYSDARVADVAE